ncbi:MAG: hypothetical protein R3C31_10015 [Hyphomonadaceae bacterium]
MLDRLVGTYQFAPGDTLVITRDGDHLVGASGPNRFSLYAETATLFFLREDNITLEFQTAGDASSPALTMTQGGQAYVYRRMQ